MKAAVLHPAPDTEFCTEERCFITEIWNSATDPNVSIAQARVEPGTSTALHHLRNTEERYLITAGRGEVKVGDLPAAAVGPGDLVVIPANVSQMITNTGESDLRFLCICTPRFEPSCYQDLEF